MASLFISSFNPQVEGLVDMGVYTFMALFNMYLLTEMSQQNLPDSKTINGWISSLCERIY